MTKNLQKFIEDIKFNEWYDSYDGYPPKSSIHIFLIRKITKAHNLAIDECLKALDKESWSKFKCNCNMCYAHEKALKHAKNNIKKLKVGETKKD